MRRDRSPAGIPRRQFLSGVAAITAAPVIGARYATARAPSPRREGDDRPELGVPGPYPGRVVEVRDPAMIRDGKRDREAIGRTLAKGLVELTGADDAVGAWRTFVEPGEVVGIKVVPNGHPEHPTSPELVLEVIDGLKAAGIRPEDMVVFDRYKREFLEAGYQDILPEGVAWGGLTPEQGDRTQMKLTFEGDDPLAGYDPDEYVEMNLVGRGQDPEEERSYRSHLGMIVSRRLDKIICLPCVKDHHAAGVTGALKNMSHGLVNNVFRSHSNPHGVAMNTYIPTVVGHPTIRRKCVLHVMDGIRGIWEGGPFGRHPEWAWDNGALLLATDPVALDHIEWDIVDAKRKEMDVPGVGSVGRMAADPFDHEGFDIRQPQYIAMAGQLGLGYFDYKSPKGRRFSIDHRVLDS